MGKCVFTICGPKCSLCCLVISIWGVIMLVSLDGDRLNYILGLALVYSEGVLVYS